MKKAVVAAVLTVSLIAGSFLNAGYLRRLEQSIRVQTELTREYIDRENYSAARAELQKGFELWQDADGYTAIALTDETVNYINDGFFSVFHELAEQDRDTAASELEHLTFRLHAMAASERITGKNIF